MNQYAQLALARYPGARIVGGDGPWAAVFRCGLAVEIYLAPDEETARRIACGGCSARECVGNHRYENVRAFSLPKCCDAPDDAEDRRYMRRRA